MTIKKIGDKTTMKVLVPIIYTLRIFMISRTSTYHNNDYVEIAYMIKKANKQSMVR